ncbi:MAG: hypothetical protein EOP49_51105, partial [Sphingobacteriales bacterium]
GEKSLEAFVSFYIPQTDPSATNWDGKEIVGMVPVLSTRDEALRLAILAIGTVALSKQTNDPSLARHGRNLYGKALVETRRALASPSRSRSTAVLAIPRVMALFEILFGADANVGNQAKYPIEHHHKNSHKNKTNLCGQNTFIDIFLTQTWTYRAFFHKVHRRCQRTSTQ